MSLNLPRFLRNTPQPLLQDYLATFDGEAFAAIPWDGRPRARSAALLAAVEGLGGPARTRLYDDVERVLQFDRDHGRKALRAVLPEGETRTLFDAVDGVEGCALFLLMRDRVLFDRALAAHFAERRLNGGLWTGLEFAGAGPPVSLCKEGLAAFQAELPVLLGDEGPRPRVAVEHFTRLDPDPASGELARREQFTVYVEGPPEAMTTFDDEAQPARQIVRRAQEAAIILDPGERTLDIIARGGAKARRAIADAFVRTMLAPGSALVARARRNLVLRILKKTLPFTLRPEDRIRSVDVVGLVLGSPDFAARVSHEAGAADARTGGCHQRALRDLGHLVSGAWSVLAAKIRITFEPEGASTRPKPVTIELRTPDRTNLRDQIERHRLIADVLLARWGFYGASR